MSRSLGLREDQREGAMLVALIAGLFPMGRIGLSRASSLPQETSFTQVMKPDVGASLLAMGPVQPVQN